VRGNICKISLIFVLIALPSARAFSQQVGYGDSLSLYNPVKGNLKPQFSYSLAGSVTVLPRLGTVTGFTISPFLSVPLSPKLSVDAGIIAGRYYSTFRNFNAEGTMNGAFTSLLVYGSANYHINSQLTVYGMGIKQLTGTYPLNFLPKSSYTIGSTYNFGSFSIGAAVSVSRYNDIFSPLPFNGYQRLYSPFDW
jgi:hypothetical protein